MSRKTNDFGKDPVPVLVLKISIPFMFAQFVNVLYSIVDRIYIGNIPVIGDVSLAGAGVCAPIITLLSSFATLIGIGGSVLFSMRLGAGDEEKAKTILANSFSLLLLFSAALTVMFLLIKGQLLRWFGASETTWPYANTYLTIYTLGTFFALLSMGMNYFITAQGFPMLGMVTTLVGAVVNTILDPVFIFLFHMNIAGAALATVIAQLCSCSFVLLVLKRRNMPVPLTLVRPEKKLSLRIVKMGFSPFLILATDSIVIIALNAVLQYFGGPEYGDTLITCATIVQSYMLLITSPMLGITGGSQPLISFNYGANHADRIRKIVFCVLMLCIGFTTFMFLVSRIIPQYFVRIFHGYTRIYGAFHLGNPGIHAGHHSPELPVCLRGRPDGAEHDPPFPPSLPVSKGGLFSGHLPSADVPGREDGLLRGTHRGRPGLFFLQHGFLFHISEISAG